MSSPDIKVIFLLSYDYEYIKNSLPCIYAEATKILISIDVNRVSWAGNKYEFDETIIEWIKEYDSESKIQFFEDNFYVPENTPMQNETRQRQLSADYLGKGGWTIQLDVDEYFIDFDSFVTFLNKLPIKYLKDPAKNKIVITANWLNLFKKDENGYFVVSKPLSPIRIATNFPYYAVARDNKALTLFTTFIIIHNTWARSKEEILFKINNWGHKNDFDTKAFYFKWLNLSQINFKTYINFNPIHPYNTLGNLEYIKVKNISSLINHFKTNKPKINKPIIFKKNFIQKLKYYFQIHEYYKNISCIRI